MSAILDSGNRRTFQTGAVRDIQEGKGRCDLLPLLTEKNTYFLPGVVNDDIQVKLLMISQYLIASHDREE